jgi:hypothetical protein
VAADNIVDVESFWKYGYTIVRGVYSTEEIERLRAGALASEGQRDLLCNPSLRDVVVDGRLVRIARTILGRDDIVYYGDSSFTITPGTPGYHKDNADRDDPNGPDWRSRYTQLRFGIYLQDHWSHSGGLNLRAKSHNTVSLHEGKTVYLRTRVGDVGVWSMCTSHSGGGTLLRFPVRWFHPHPRLVRRIPAFLRAAPHATRVSLFVALGADDEHHERYVQYAKTRTYLATSFRNSVYDEEALSSAEAAGLRVRDVRREIEGDDSVGKNAKWAAIPY